GALAALQVGQSALDVDDRRCRSRRSDGNSHRAFPFLIHGWRLRERQPDEERASLAQNALNAQVATHGLHQALGERQSEAGALDIGCFRSQALERYEEPIQQLWADPWAIVAHVR